MGIIFIVFSLLLGIFVGSFLNVLILRLGTGRGFVSGRSVCLSCGKTLLAIDLVPVASYLVLLGRCRFCKTPLSLQYPVVETVNGIFFALAAYMTLPLWAGGPLVAGILLLAYWAILSLMLSILVYDIRHKIIPNVLAYSLAAVSLVFVFVSGSSFALPSIWQVLAGPIVALPVFLLWFFSGGRWMGLGDAKLVWSFGWVLGISKAFTAVIFGFWIGAIFALVVLAFQKLDMSFIYGEKLSMKSEIPFAPFLILGFLIVFFFGFNLFVAIL